jgi:hypothetical protein
VVWLKWYSTCLANTKAWVQTLVPPPKKTKEDFTVFFFFLSFTEESHLRKSSTIFFHVLQVGHGCLPFLETAGAVWERQLVMHQGVSAIDSWKQSQWKSAAIHSWEEDILPGRKGLMCIPELEEGLESIHR